MTACGDIPEPVDFHGGIVSASVAARTGLQREWGIMSEGDLTLWFRANGFPSAQVGNHISTRAQEHILSEASASDARVVLLESVFVVLTLHRGRQIGMTPRLSGPQGSTPMPAVHDPQNPHADNWSSLDQVDLGDVFSQRIPTLNSCPHFLRGRFRFSFSFALRERHRAREDGDVLAETRAWKLFGLIPMMLLHRPRGSGSVGRDELCKRADEFARGHWMELIQSAGVERTDEEERTRRGVVAKNGSCRARCLEQDKF